MGDDDLMDLQKAREFVTLGGYMNFTAAARALNMSQSALSKHVRDLEQELGVELIARGGINEANRLTAAGKLFLSRIQAILADYDQLARECRATQEQPPRARVHQFLFTLGMSDQIVAALEAKGVQSGWDLFEPKPFDLDVRTALDTSTIDLGLHFETGPCPAAFSSGPDLATYGTIPLEPERIVLVVRADSPLATADSVTLADLDECTWVNDYSASYRSWYDAVERLFGEHGCVVKWKLVSREEGSGRSFSLEQGDVSACAEGYARAAYEANPLTTTIVTVREFDPVVYPFLVYRRDNENPCVRAIVNHLAGDE